MSANRFAGCWSRLYTVMPCAVVAVLSGSPTAVAAQLRFGTDATMKIGPATALDESAEHGRIMGSAIGHDGRFCIADDMSARVSCYRPDGTRLFAVGRAGEGPGEFQTLYRVGIASDGRLFAYDLTKGSVSIFGADGKFVREARLPMRFSQVGSFAAGPGNTVILTGNSIAAGYATDSAVHVFALGDSAAHVRSFGPLPKADNRRKADLWGPGWITVLGDRSAYSQRYPYVIHNYVGAGKSSTRVNGPVRLTHGPDEVFAFKQDGIKSSIGVNPTPTAQFIGPLHAVDSTLAIVSRRVGADLRWFDLYDVKAGRFLSTAAIPPAVVVGNILGIDWKHGRMYLAALCDDAPCVKVAPVDFRRLPAQR